MKISLEQILTKHLCKALIIKLVSGAEFRGYIIGMRFPVRELIMLYYVPLQHVDKYIKHGNARWVDVLPFEMIESIEFLAGNSIKETALKARIQDKDSISE